MPAQVVATEGEAHQRLGRFGASGVGPEAEARREPETERAARTRLTASMSVLFDAIPVACAE